MATIGNDTGPRFERGIERVTFTRGQAVQTLPNTRELPPPEAAVESNLARIFRQPNLNQWLLENFRPHLTDRSLFVPTVFKLLVLETGKSLNAAAQRTPADSRVLRRAADILSDAHRLNEHFKERSNELLLG